MRNVLGAGILVVLSAMPVAAQPIADQYPGDWQEDPLFPIIKALSANHVKGCGEFHWKVRAGQSASDPAPEFLVYCTRDGETWTEWIVWPAIEKVVGPTSPDPSVPPPY